MKGVIKGNASDPLPDASAAFRQDGKPEFIVAQLHTL